MFGHLVRKAFLGSALVVALGVCSGTANATPSLTAVNGSFAFNINGTDTYTPNQYNFNSFSWPDLTIYHAKGDYASAGVSNSQGQTLDSSLCGGSCSSAALTFVVSGDGKESQTINDFLSWTDLSGNMFEYNVSSWTFSTFPASTSSTLVTIGTLLESDNGGATWTAEGTARTTFGFPQSGGSVSGSGVFSSGSYAAVPEPASLAILGLSLAGLGVTRRRKG